MKVWLLVDGDGTDGGPWEVKGVFADRPKALAAGEAMILEFEGAPPRPRHHVERRIQDMHEDSPYAVPHVEEWDVQ